MTKSVEEYKKDIKNALKKANSYTTGLDFQIGSLASALRTLDLANEEIDGLESPTVLEETRYGSKHAPHPVFKIQKDAQDSITRQLKALGLTAADLAGETDDDPLYDLTKKVKNAGRKKARIVKPNTK
jgi:hypothetical protein